MPHAPAAGRLLARKGVRICWETNGMMHPKLLDQAVQLALETGGCVKFDLTAFDENLHIALTGASNRRTLENFQRAAARIPERPQLPLVVASTLLIPGCVDAGKVYRIARFIAAIDPDIPYTLLAFASHFLMTDLPCTPSTHTREAVEAAQAAGLDPHPDREQLSPGTIFSFLTRKGSVAISTVPLRAPSLPPPSKRPRLATGRSVLLDRVGIFDEGAWTCQNESTS